MTKKLLVLALEFDEEYDDMFDFMDLIPRRVYLHPDTTIDEADLDNLGDAVAQTDRWQVDNWNAIQLVMGGQSEAELR